MTTPPPSKYAGRGARLLAQIIDGLIVGVPAIVLYLIALAPVMKVIQESQLSGVPLESPPLPGMGALLVLFLWIIGFTAVQWVYLTTRGQSIGKIIMKVKIVRLTDGANGGFVPNVLLRRIVNRLLNFVPVYGIVDIFFIFREDRRCIHDLIAGTVVVKA